MILGLHEPNTVSSSIFFLDFKIQAYFVKTLVYFYFASRYARIYVGLRPVRELGPRDCLILILRSNLSHLVPLSHPADRPLSHPALHCLICVAICLILIYSVSYRVSSRFTLSRISTGPLSHLQSSVILVQLNAVQTPNVRAPLSESRRPAN